MNIKRIKELLEIMKEYGLQTLEVEEEGVRYRFDRESATPTVTPVVMPIVPPANGPIQTVTPSAETSESETPGAVTSEMSVKAQMVGTFYRASAPEAESFVQVGDHVIADTVIGIIEAMKVMNEITADCSGTIREILIGNAQPVEYGQVIFLIEPDTEPGASG